VGALFFDWWVNQVGLELGLLVPVSGDGGVRGVVGDVVEELALEFGEDGYRVAWVVYHGQGAEVTFSKGASLVRVGVDVGPVVGGGSRTLT